MKLKPGCAEEYERRHDELWPELRAALEDAGVYDYSIFLDEATGTLFAVQKLAEGHSADALPEHPVVRRWWEAMKDLMETHPDHAPVEVPLREVFRLE